MTKAEEILEKHLVIMDAETMIGKHGRTHKAVINAINEAINYTHCCTELKCKQVIPFEDWRKENCKHLDGDLYSFKHNVFDSYDLRYVYMRECKQSL
jgi:hypothetical protein